MKHGEGVVGRRGMAQLSCAMWVLCDVGFSLGGLPTPSLVLRRSELPAVLLAGEG